VRQPVQAPEAGLGIVVVAGQAGQREEHPGGEAGGAPVFLDWK
jgi:hypothetical protein